MRAHLLLCVSLTLLIGLLAPATGHACDVCGCSFNSRRSGPASPLHPDRRPTGGGFILTPTATTLGQGHGTVGFLFEHQRFNSIPAGDAHTLHHQGHEVHGKAHEEFYNLSLGYGLREDLDLFVIVPVVSKTSIEIESHAALGQRGTAAGLGDLRLVGKYRFWEREADAALLLGVKAPTGSTSETGAAGTEFGPELQPGTGSWDLMTGLAVSRSFGHHLAAAGSVRYLARGEGAKDAALGDLFHGTLGVSYALRPFGTHPNLSAALELHHEWALRDHSREQDKVWDSGGTTILLSPGFSAELTEQVSVFWAMPIPVYQNLGGQHEELRYEVITGLAWHF